MPEEGDRRASIEANRELEWETVRDRVLRALLSPDSPIYDLAVPRDLRRRLASVAACGGSGGGSSLSSSDGQHSKRQSLIDPLHVGAPGSGLSLAIGSRRAGDSGAALSAGLASATTSVASGDIGRVTRWALGLDKLLQDESGVAVFTDFLKKEHSEENIAFWLACEKFRRAVQQEKLGLAREIFNTHMSPRGTQAVNVDSAAYQHAEEQLAAPTDGMFDEAQKQVFHLMKMDCYARFLKSDLYKNCIVADMEEHRLSDASVAATSTQVFKDDVSEESSDASETRRRRSLLLFLKESAKTFARNADVLGRSRSSDADFLLKKQLDKEHQQQPVAQGRQLLQPGHHRHATKQGLLALTDLEPTSVREEADVIIVQSSSDDDVQERANTTGGDGRRSVTPRMQHQQRRRPRVRRFVMPDGSPAEVGTAESAADTMRTIVERLCARHGVPLASVEVLAIGSDKPLDLSRKLSEMDPCAEFIMERRAVFRLEMPKRKSIAVRAKPQRLALDVLRPLLHKYGYSLGNVALYLDGQPLAHDAIVSTIDSRRVSVHQRSDLDEWVDRVKTHRSLSKSSSAGSAQHSHGAAAADDSDAGSRSDQYYCSSDGSSSVEDVVDFEKAAFQERVRGGGLLGRLRPASTAEDRALKARRKNKVHFAPSKPISPTFADGVQSSNDDDGLHLLDLITKAQGTQYDDQRGAHVHVGELPAFLLQPSVGVERGGVRARHDGASKSKADPNVSGGVHRSDAADVYSHTYSQRDVTTSVLPANVLPAHDGGGGSCLEPLDVSFSASTADSRLPTHEEADAVFASARLHLGGGSPLEASSIDASDDDDRTPTRQPQSSGAHHRGGSYRAALLVAGEQTPRGGGPSGSIVGAVSDDQSWYRPHWDSTDAGGVDECETEVSADDEAAVTVAFDPDRTLTAADGMDGSSADLSMAGSAAVAGYLPPPSPFENSSEASFAAGAAAATPSRRSVPPPYSMAVARSLALAGGVPAVAAASSSAAPASQPPAIPPASLASPSTPRAARSSTLPGSRLSYASRPLIVDDDDGGGSGHRSDDSADGALLCGDAETSFAAAAAQTDAFRSAGPARAAPMPAASNHGSRKLAANGRPLAANGRPLLPSGGTAAHLLPQYGFYQDSRNSAQEQPSMGIRNAAAARSGGLPPSLGAAAAVPSAGSKITFV